MKASAAKIVLTLVLAAAIVALGFSIYQRMQEQAEAGAVGAGGRLPAPVEVAPIEHGEIVQRRTFSGALEPTAEFVVASKVSGRIERVEVDLADQVRRSAVVVVLEADELEQAVLQARADLEVARANAAEARSALDVGKREFERVELLHARGISSESQLDAARSELLAREAHVEVTEAQVARAESLLEAARIRLGYAQITADWTGGNDVRLVAERLVDEGDTVSPNQALLSIIELDPVTGVLYVPERDYGRLAPGQPVRVTTQAWPDDRFEGTIARIAPVFRESSRQARVEFTIPNPGQRLKPGMFVRATVELERAADATIVPEAALTERAGETGVFLVSADGRSVAWRPVEPGIREEGRVQVKGEGLDGRVVTLGQQLVDDGSAIVIPEESGAAGEAPL